MQIHQLYKKYLTLNYVVLLIFILKLYVVLFLSSGISNSQILIFVDHFIKNFDNTYDYFTDSNISFSYPPFMLYFLAIFRLPYTLSGLYTVGFAKVLFSLPLFIADFLILYTLFSLFPKRKNSTVLFYFLNPIIIYSSFYQFHLDLIPTSLIFLSAVLLIKYRIRFSFIILSFASSLNIFTVFLVPIVIIYLIRHAKLRRIIKFTAIYFIINSLAFFPFGFSKSLATMVYIPLASTLITDTFITFKNIHLYPTLIGIVFVYAALFRHRKINQDLLFSYFGILFSIFVLLVKQHSGGYVWFVPFLVCFFVNFRFSNKNNYYFYLSLSLGYLIHFVLSDNLSTSTGSILYGSIWAVSSDVKNVITNVSFSILEAVVCINIFIYHKYAAKSNNFYQYEQILSFGIGGDSGTGKSKLLKDLKDMFKNKLLDIEGDGDHKWVRGDSHWDNITHLNPKANYIYDQANNIRLLKEGKSIYRREYIHKDGTFSKQVKISPRNYIVLCGLHPFYLPLSRKILDIKIYMDTDEKIRRHWKVIRDTKKRGYSIEKVLHQINDRKEDSIKYILPQKQYADFIIRYYSDDNYTVGDEMATPQVKLKVIFDANLQVENLVLLLEKNGIKVDWDYMENLEKQYLIVHNKPPENSISYFKEYLQHNIVNIDELIDVNMDVQWGYRGIIQILILKIVSLYLSEGLKK